MNQFKNLLTFQNAKTSKGEKKGYLTGILYLKPAESGGLGNLCPNATAGCKASCLNTAGRGAFDQVQAGRQRKTEAYKENPQKFVESLNADVQKLVKMAQRKNLIPCVRINGTSDIPALAHVVAKANPDVQFYDYTKNPKPYKRTLKNYHLTFSKSENNMGDCLDALENGINVAVVFEKALPKKYLGYKVINGDETDLRFLDKKSRNGKGVIVGLKAKGRAKKDKTGFTVRGLA
jgi:hypothetical protein